jgi:hypothetical protein
LRKTDPGPRHWRVVSIQRDGEVYRGEYFVEAGLLTVSMIGGGRSTTHESAARDTVTLAKLMLGELVAKKQLKGK